MTIRLRPHHFLCMLTFVGEGYSPRFVVNYGRIIDRIRAGEPVVMVEGPDDICAPLLGTDDPHCHNDSVRLRDAQALADVAALTGLALETGGELVLDGALIARLQAGFAAGSIRKACGGCQWSGLCDQVAGSGFAGTRVQGG
ncbi:DUF1284 domain-containing protein [Microvirga tunisiensis]|uniref:DUF1284 domain-containing protein n=1 Tax=Pannonibacter tanglangensis TaxID=2750084 RepID=A0A7X5F4V5_9HYPH|nr:DUF1284 domain-containing protein [Pannonibacter sp. XCT-53]NBN78519.1 DUF1284 domain-containing protein [Pannonibacter sp. XCT-53]